MKADRDGHRSGPGGWQLWSLPGKALALILVVDLAAVGIAVGTANSLAAGGTHWWWFAALVCGSVAHLEVARSIERRREQSSKGVPYTNLKSLWVFAAVLLVPLPLVIALTVISYGYCWARVYGPSVAHRKAYSAATFVLASAAASAVLHAGGLDQVPRLPKSAWSLLVIAAAAAVWWLVNYALVVFAIVLSTSDTSVRQALGDPADQLVVAAALGLGVTVAALLVTVPWALPAPMVAVLAVHRDLLLPQYLRAARTDAKTGLAAPTFWTDVVNAELDRARLAGTTVGVIFLDLDRFKQINDTHGHPAGDEAIRAVADTVRGEVRGADLVSRWGGDELAIVLPGIGHHQLHAVAERIRLRLARTPITLTRTKSGVTQILPGVTTSMGLASFPGNGVDADQLVLAADHALLDAKRNGRNQSVFATSI
ncbi:GGDEF domain-containing protein [Amycolatopsis sp. NPDC059027]|uniref:GGDEF domain-containing protein n=1 Tax=Amycolatopsis sp. NPDC059027 TaxID=3346709 RepID=UPI00366A951A